MTTVTEQTATTKSSEDHKPVSIDVLIVGAGFGGIAAALALQNNGFTDYKIIEKSDRIGGTWRDNNYPGAQCDVPSYLYSLAGADDFNWDKNFADQEQIYSYLQHVVSSKNLTQKIDLGVELLQARWVDNSQAKTSLPTAEKTKNEELIQTPYWEIKTTNTIYYAKKLILATGPLSEARLPDISGLDTFQGPIIHTAAWDHTIDLANKKVAVIGTGASGVQVIPPITKVAAQVSVYQRSAPWVLPKVLRPITHLEQKIYHSFPLARKILRLVEYAARETQVIGLAKNKKGLIPLENFGRWNIDHVITDEQLRRKVTPTFTVGCKRILLSNDYYPALNLPTTEVITTPIKEISADSIITTDGEKHPADIIVFATGFEVIKPKIAQSIIGLNETTLADSWDHHGIQAYHGITVPNFPNFFMVLGPSSAVGHTSMVFMAQSQIRYIIKALKFMNNKKIKSIELSSNNMNKYWSWLERKLNSTVWLNGNCTSWYKTGDGKGPMIWPTWTFFFDIINRRFDSRAYEQK